jgi:hypothetical protein
MQAQLAKPAREYRARNSCEQMPLTSCAAPLGNTGPRIRCRSWARWRFHLPRVKHTIGMVALLPMYFDSEYPNILRISLFGEERPISKEEIESLRTVRSEIATYTSARHIKLSDGLVSVISRSVASGRSFDNGRLLSLIGKAELLDGHPGLDQLFGIELSAFVCI